MLNDKIPFNEKKAFDLNIILENNLRDLRKKLEESQVERLMLEDQNNTYIKSMKDKNTLIAHLEKEIQEIKKKSFRRKVTSFGWKPYKKDTRRTKKIEFNNYQKFQIISDLQLIFILIYYLL